MPEQLMSESHWSHVKAPDCGPSDLVMALFQSQIPSPAFRQPVNQHLGVCRYKQTARMFPDKSDQDLGEKDVRLVRCRFSGPLLRLHRFTAAGCDLLGSVERVGTSRRAHWLVLLVQLRNRTLKASCAEDLFSSPSTQNTVSAFSPRNRVSHVPRARKMNDQSLCSGCNSTMASD